jgi:hypothetical protein
MTLFQLRAAGLTVGGESPDGRVLVRCPCGKWGTPLKRWVVAKAQAGRGYRCASCANRSNGAKFKPKEGKA